MTTFLSQFRPPAVPLVTHDPYFSVWSTTDALTDGWARHWTGALQPMCSLVRIDGKPFRIMGTEPSDAPALAQVARQVWPTRTIYCFETAGVRLTLTFTTPTLPHDLNLVGRPVTYLTWDVQAVDGRAHQVSLYFDVTGHWAVNTHDQEVVWSRYRLPDLAVMRVGSWRQLLLEKSGDHLRIDWGYLYLAYPKEESAQDAMADHRSARHGFASGTGLPSQDDLRMPRSPFIETPVLACAFDLGAVGTETVSRHLMLAYDDLFCMEYMQRRLRPFWRRDGKEIDGLLRVAEAEYADLVERCRAFDEDLVRDLAGVGGEAYACLAALAFRQCLSGHKLAADGDGAPVFLSKENFSNGCMGTVDVLYPASPLFLLFNLDLLKAQLWPVLDYAASRHWPHPFAPHDLGRYPLANGQVYGGGAHPTERQMPVEECGNMLLLVAATVRASGDVAFVQRYWPVLTQWAEYLRDKGLDPENQLCTDDFAGHLAHNANLSLKAILALGGYSLLCETVGETEQARSYRELAGEMAQRWMELADDGDHYRLAFDRPGTWSQKYNLVWNELLDLHLFPAQVAQKEISFYKTQLNRYGLPLDNRNTYTKLDWIVWSASLATSAEDFGALVEPAYRFAHETPDRVPLSDWYWTEDARQRGFQARTVVGGIYLKMLCDRKIWQKWSNPGA